MNATVKNTTIATVAITCAIALAGCTGAAPVDGATPIPTVSIPVETATPEPAETDSTVELSVQPGDTITMQEAKILHGMEDTALGYYKTTDGVYVVVDSTAPLGDEIVADVVSQAEGRTVSQPDGRNIPAAGYLVSKAKELTASTGRTVYLVSHLEATVGGGPVWMIQPWDQAYYGSESEARAAAEANAGTSDIDVIIVDYLN